MSNLVSPPNDHDSAVLDARIRSLQQQRDLLLAQNHTLRHQQTLLELSNTLAFELSALATLDDIFNCVANKITQMLAFEDCAIFRVDATAGCLRCVASAGRFQDESRLIGDLAFGQGIVGRCAQQASPQLVNEPQLDADYVAIERQVCSELAVPVFDGEQVCAVIDSEHASPGFFTSEHQEILQHVATILAVKLAKVADLHRLEQTIAKLEYAELVQKALFNIASISYDPQNLRKFYQQIHQNVSSLIYAPNFYIALYNEQEQALHFPYFVDTTEHISPSEVYPKEILQNSLTGYVFRSNEPLLIHGAGMADFDQQHGVNIYGTKPESWLGVPFKSGETVSGVVVVQSYDAEFTYGQPDLELLVFVSQHISTALERVFVQQRLVQQALHDALTTLPNRVLFMDRVSHAFKRRKRMPEQVVAIMYLDLDRFKIVNDTLGHMVGDEFLVAVSALLQTCVRETDTLARLGGDEFAILLEDVHAIEDVVAVAERICQTLQKPVQLRQHQLQTSTSIGIALATIAETDIDQAELIRRADIAMYQAKQDGRGIWRQFSEAMDNSSAEDYLAEIELRQAVADHQFMLHFQPIIDLQTSNTLGFEALLRWQHPRRGLLAAAEFIGLAEALGLMPAIDEQVLQAAVAQAHTWRILRAAQFYISVNISARSFCETTFVPALISQLQHAQLPGAYIAIEITEHTNMAQAKQQIDALRQAGVRVLLDDFGTGYSSLSYLHEFHIDVLKIDRSFVASLRPRLAENPVVNTIIALAKTMQLPVIAEGVETSLQRKILAELGCHAGQGYWFAKPMSAKEALEWLL